MPMREMQFPFAFFPNENHSLPNKYTKKNIESKDEEFARGDCENEQLLLPSAAPTPKQATPTLRTLFDSSKSNPT